MNEKWIVSVYDKRTGMNGDWAFKFFFNAMRFAKSKLKKGYSVAIERGKPRILMVKGDYK